jgi:hypothetical protein
VFQQLGELRKGCSWCFTTDGTDFNPPSEPSFSERQEVPICLKRGVYKRPQRVWKPKRKKHRLVMGMDVGLEEACNLALCALVGRTSVQGSLHTKAVRVDEVFLGACSGLFT